MNNSVFGKTMENIRRHRNIKLVNNKEEYLKTVMKPNFKSGTLLGDDLMGCEMGKVKVVMNKPIYLAIGWETWNQRNAKELRSALLKRQ